MCFPKFHPSVFCLHAFTVTESRALCFLPASHNALFAQFCLTAAEVVTVNMALYSIILSASERHVSDRFKRLPYWGLNSRRAISFLRNVRSPTDGL